MKNQKFKSKGLNNSNREDYNDDNSEEVFEKTHTKSIKSKIIEQEVLT